MFILSIIYSFTQFKTTQKVSNKSLSIPGLPKYILYGKEEKEVYGKLCNKIYLLINV